MIASIEPAGRGNEARMGRTQTIVSRGLTAALVLAVLGCDENECGGMELVVRDAQTGALLEDAEVVLASTVYARRHRADGFLPVGTYHLWARAPGYRQRHEPVSIESDMRPSDEACPDDAVYEVLLRRAR